MVAIPVQSPVAQVTSQGKQRAGKVEHDTFVVEKLHFQSRPHLYVTGDLYLPKDVHEQLPAILYVCGHGGVKKNGISYGNKVHYQHHGAWFARNGYVCLVIDSLQLGEIESIHHGTYRYGMWWWNARGYTPAGVEAWNCIRALDYLQSRPEVDGDRIGVTGRSGGGAYSWWIAALDDRIKAAVPVAGITTLHNHVVDGTVEGHCDCMFVVNTYRWDYPQIATLVAPRPLLISNSDKDRIFPLDGVVETYNKVRRVYELYGKLNHVGLQITEGPHKDTQELRVHAFHWLNRWLKGEDPLIEQLAVPFFEPEQLKVFDVLPDDEQNTTIHETFTAKASPPSVPKSTADWNGMRGDWMQALRAKCFRGWPDEGNPQGLNVTKAFAKSDGRLQLCAYDFVSQGPIRLRLYLAIAASTPADQVRQGTLHVLDAEGWTEFLATMQVAFADQLQPETLPAPDPDTYDRLVKSLESSRQGIAFVAPRGIGPTAWNPDPRKQTQIRRRFMLLGQTLDGMRVWDVRRAIQALRTLHRTRDLSLQLHARGPMAGIALYAALFEPDVQVLELHDLPDSHRNGPIFLNVLRFLDTPQAVAMAAEDSEVHIFQPVDSTADWQYPKAVVDALGWNAKSFTVHATSEPNGPQPSPAERN